MFEYDKFKQNDHDYNYTEYIEANIDHINTDDIINSKSENNIINDSNNDQ